MRTAHSRLASRQGQQKFRSRNGNFAGREGIDFIRCRICGDRYRVINLRHLSKHETDRETYMTVYCLSPDELRAKDFRRRISAGRRKPSSRRRYYPYGKRDWIEAIKKTHKQGSSICAGSLIPARSRHSRIVFHLREILKLHLPRPLACLRRTRGSSATLFSSPHNITVQRLQPDRSTSYHGGIFRSATGRQPSSSHPRQKYFRPTTPPHPPW